MMQMAAGYVIKLVTNRYCTGVISFMKNPMLPVTLESRASGFLINVLLEFI